MSLKRKLSFSEKEDSYLYDDRQNLKTKINERQVSGTSLDFSTQTFEEPVSTHIEPKVIEDQELLADGGTIKAGYIKSIKLLNFMCHEHFQIELTPNLNFIIGNNGTGKSAILTAIAVGLGATASQAQRSGQLKGLIRHGAEKASVTIILNNTGDFAYQPEMYGDEIVLERSITLTANKFRVKIDKKFQDLKTVHLKAMLNYLGIRINNPMVFLNQDMAKKFLTSATKKEKYENFASANYFNFVYGNYADIKKNLESVEIALSEVKPNLDKLQLEAEKSKALLLQIKDSKEKLALVSDMRKLHAYKKLNQLQSEIRTITTKIIEKSELVQRCESIKNGEYSVTIKSFEENIKELDENLNILRQDIDDISDKIRQTNLERQNFEREIQSLKSDSTFYTKQLKKQESELDRVRDTYDISLKEFNSKANQNNQKLLEKKQNKNQEIIVLNDKINKNFELKSKADEELYSLEEEKRSSLAQLSKKIMESQTILNETHNKMDVLSSFGPNMVKCMKEINNLTQSGRFSSPPVGPLGSLVTIKGDYEAAWAVLVQNRLLNQLNAFVVSNQSDKSLLEGVLKKYKLDRRFNYIIRKMSLFDYSRDIPKGENLLKMTDILEFNSEAVKCVFVDLSNIHTLLLAEDYEESQIISKRYPYSSVLAVTKPHGFLLTTSNGAKDIITTRKLTRTITMNNQNKYLENIEHDLMKYKAEFRDLTAQFLKKKEDLVTTKHKLSKDDFQWKQKKRIIGNEIDTIQNQLDSFQDTNKIDSLKSEVIRLEDTINVTKHSLQNLENEILNQKKALAPFDEDIVKLEAASNKLNNEYKEDENNKADIIVQLDNYDKEAKKAEKQAVIATNEVSVLHEEVRRLKEQYKTGKQDLKAHMEVLRYMMGKFGDMSEQQIYKKILSLESEINSNTDFSVQDIANLEINASDAITNFKRERMNYKSFKNLLVKMENILHQKNRTYLNHQTDCFNETNKMFTKYMKFRGFVGNLVFQNPYALSNSDSDIDNGKINTGELSIYARSKEESESRDVDTLSGGEKSFAQMSLLLSTWCVISSRIIALDEFDVFMDNINRTIGTKLIIQSLKDRVQTQTVIITPQDITAIADTYINDPHIKIHKMNAIVRNNE